MGLTIHYSGGIDRTDQIAPLVDELEDIAESMGWMSQRINEDESDPDFFGIIVNPKGDCEPLCFIFDRQGRLRNLADLITDQIEPTEYSEYCSTKTQFTSVETHIWIIGLLRYLKKHYFSNLSVEDEGDFWETQNRKTLIEKKNFLQSKIDQLGGALQSSEGEIEFQSLEDMIAHIERIARGLD
ncbi:MAG: hypothetical protein ACSHYA_15235 [Opitutaceae bacterium]